MEIFRRVETVSCGESIYIVLVNKLNDSMTDILIVSV